MSKLLVRTRELLIDALDNKKKDIAVISVETGLTYGWIKTVRYKPDVIPAVDKVERLYEYLSGNQLEVK